MALWVQLGGGGSSPVDNLVLVEELQAQQDTRGVEPANRDHGDTDWVWSQVSPAVVPVCRGLPGLLTGSASG